METHLSIRQLLLDNSKSSNASSPVELMLILVTQEDILQWILQMRPTLKNLFQRLLKQSIVKTQNAKISLISKTSGTIAVKVTNFSARSALLSSSCMNSGIVKHQKDPFVDLWSLRRRFKAMRMNLLKLLMLMTTISSIKL
jgi:hypothetical protein